MKHFKNIYFMGKFSGDENDLPMIEYAGIGIAMANATENVKKAASFITTSNDEHGVAVAIEKFVL